MVKFKRLNIQKTVETNGQLYVLNDILKQTSIESTINYVNKYIGKEHTKEQFIKLFLSKTQELLNEMIVEDK